MELGVRTDERDGWAVVTVHGDLDLTTAPRLRERVIEAVLGGHPHVVLDLQEVDFVDSSGLGVLVSLLKRARTHGGDLRLVSTRANLERLLSLTGLDRALPLSPDVPQAIGAERG